MRAVLLVIAAMVAGAQGAPGSCAPPPDVEQSRVNSVAVFVGEALAVRDSFEVFPVLVNGLPQLVETSPGTRVALLRVLCAWKGIRADSVLTVVCSTQGTRFTVGDRYIVYADSISTWSRALAGWREHALHAGDCSRTRELRYAVEDMKLLGLTVSDADWLKGPYRTWGDSVALTTQAHALAHQGAKPDARGKRRGRGH
jgi:hypothetical protein